MSKKGEKKKPTLDQLIQAVDKKFGKGTIMRASEYPKLPRISTGIFSLDMEMGGGVPKGRILIFVGNESTGKTTVALKTAVEFQYTCRKCLSPMLHVSDLESQELEGVGPVVNPLTGEVMDMSVLKFSEGRYAVCPKCDDGGEPHKVMMVDVEGTFDPTWFMDLGGNIDALYLTAPEFAEQTVDLVEGVIRTGEIDLIIIDSIAMMTPAAEIEGSAEDPLVGTAARLNNRMMRAIQAGFNSLGMQNPRKPSVILINQVREKVGVMFGNPETIPGGRGQRFASSITVKFTARPSERVWEGGKKKDDDPSSRPVGVQIRFTCEKNKTFQPYRSGTFTLYTADTEEYGYFKGEVDNEEQMVWYGLQYNVIEQAGSWLTYKDVRVQGKQAMAEVLMSRPDLRLQIRQEVFDAINKSIRRRPIAGSSRAMEAVALWDKKKSGDQSTGDQLSDEDLDTDVVDE